MASIGAFVAGDRAIIDYIRYNIRSQIFAKSLPMAFVIGNLKRLELLRTRPEYILDTKVIATFINGKRVYSLE